MRLLADENFPLIFVERLRADGHDVVFSRESFPGSTDPFLLDYAESVSRILLTLDRDFWQLAVQRRVPLQHAGVVLFRVHPASPVNLAPLINVFLRSAESCAAHVSVISRHGIQMVNLK